MAEKNSKVGENREHLFKKGRQKTGGRQKGTPNKKTTQFKEILGDFDTVKEMMILFATTDKDDLKFAICKEFMKYEYPQRKAVDLDVGNVELPEISIEGI